MYFTFHHLMGFSVMALGLGLMILSYFMGWNPPGLVVFGAGLGAVASGWAYLRGF